MSQTDQTQQPGATGTDGRPNTTLWVGDLAFWMDESYLYNLFVASGELQSVKVIRNKATGASEGYGFVQFRTHAAAEAVLRTFNGVPIPNSDQVFRLNWAAFGVGRGASEDFSVFVGDLAPDVTDYVLQENFRQFFPSVRSAKVITDPLTGKSKGYGFVRFSNEAERDRALTEMNGHFLSSRPIRVSLATAKKSVGPQQQHQQLAAIQHGNMASMLPPGSDADPTNTTLFIGGLSGNVSEAELRSIFGRFGDIVYVKIPTGKACGFVQYVDRGCAERAMAQMHAHVIGNGPVRISWGRSSANRGAAGTHPMAGAAAYPLAGGAGYGPMYGHFAAQPFAGAMYGAAGPAGGAADFAAAYGSSAAGFALQGGVDSTAGASFFGAGFNSKAAGAHVAEGKQFIAGLGSTLTHNGTVSGKSADTSFDALSDGLTSAYLQSHQAGLVGGHLF